MAEVAKSWKEVHRGMVSVMDRSRRRAAIAGAMVLVGLISLVGCASEDYDGVLWRQVAAYKDPFGRTLVSAVGTEREVFVDSMKDQFWDGSSDPGNLSVERGGVVLFDLQEEPDDVTFAVLISSGPRNAAADPLADSGPYAGPFSIYTCFAVTVDFDAGIASGWTRDDHECDSRLVATLGDGARFVPVIEFDG